MSYFLPPTTKSNSPKPPAPSHDLSLNSVKKQPKPDKEMSEKGSSIGGWWKSRLPKQRPERGSTIRQRGYWEQVEGQNGEASYPRRRATDSQRSRRSETGDSDLITRWNTPKDLPEPRENTPSHPRRAFSAMVSKAYPTDGRRQVSWAPPGLSIEGENGRLPLLKAADPEQQETAAWNGQIQAVGAEGSLGLPGELDLSTQASLAADRRLSNARRAIEAKREIRRRRRHLKESGDYLGVQGINPDTGLLDVITPSDSGNSSVSQETTQKINSLRQAVRNARSNYKQTALRSERELKKIMVDKETQRLAKDQEQKDELNRLNQGLLKWRRHTRQWSSAQEPNLSPIAQSHRSGASTSKRLSLPIDEIAEEGILVDLGSPVKFGDIQLEEGIEPNNGTSAGTPRSLGTVIHTPQRRSTANFTSGAQELFENGISFDDYNLTGANLEDDAMPNSPRLEMAGFEADASLDIRPSPSIRSPASIPATERTITAIRETDETTPPDQSFLDIQSLDDRSTEEKGLALSENLSEVDLPVEESLTTKRRKFAFLMNPRKRREARGVKITTPPSLDSLEACLAKNSKNDKQAEVSVPNAQFDVKAARLRDIDQLPSFFHRTEKINDRGAPPKKVDDKVTVQAQEKLQKAQSHSMTKPGLVNKKYVKLCREESERDNFLRERIQREIDGLKESMAKIDCGSPSRLKVPQPAAKGEAWIEDVMRDIAKKGDEVKERSVSTHITTTTGCDHQMSGSNPTQDQSSQKKAPQEAQRQSPALEYSTPIMTSPTWRLSHRNPRLNTSPNLKTKTQLTQIVTTSTNQTMLLGPSTQRTATERANTCRLRRQARKRFSKSPMSISPLLYTPPVTLTKGQEVSRETDVAQEDDHVPLNQVRIEISISTSKLEEMKVAQTPNTVNMNQPVKEQSQLNLQSATITSKPCVKDSLLSLMERCPGAYPSHLDDRDDTVALFGISSMLTLEFFSGLSLVSSVKRLYHALRWFFNAVILLVRVYASFVGPFFDKSSEYWSRNAGGESSCRDYLVTILAIPVGILAPYALV